MGKIEQAAENLPKILNWTPPELLLDDGGVPWKQRLAALEETKLYRQYALARHQMRIAQASSFFPYLSEDDEIIKTMMGEAHTNTTNEKFRKNFPWTFNHHDNKMDPGWGNDSPTVYIKSHKAWSLNPFTVEHWRVVQHFEIDKVSFPIPSQVALAINHLQKLNFFNVFRAYESSTKRVMITGELWDLVPIPESRSRMLSSDGAAVFLVAYLAGPKKV